MGEWCSLCVHRRPQNQSQNRRHKKKHPSAGHTHLHIPYATDSGHNGRRAVNRTKDKEYVTKIITLGTLFRKPSDNLQTFTGRVRVSMTTARTRQKKDTDPTHRIKVAPQTPRKMHDVKSITPLMVTGGMVVVTDATAVPAAPTPSAFEFISRRTTLCEPVRTRPSSHFRSGTVGADMRVVAGTSSRSASFSTLQTPSCPAVRPARSRAFAGAGCTKAFTL